MTIIHTKINKKVIGFLAARKKIRVTGPMMNQLYLRKKSLNQQWGDKGEIIIQLLYSFFGLINADDIRVLMVPEELGIGAVETDKKEIIFGHKKRSSYYDLAILTHELAHIFLKKYHNIKLVDETICFILEDKIYRLFDKLTLDQIWKPEELDAFHRQAFNLAIKFVGPHLETYQKLASLIEKKTEEFQNILEPKKGLLKNI